MEHYRSVFIVPCAFRGVEEMFSSGMMPVTKTFWPSATQMMSVLLIKAFVVLTVAERGGI